MTGSEEQNNLVMKILKGEVHKTDVERELDRIEKQYGKECFNGYVVKKRPMPWGNDYLSELEILSASGAASKEFFIHMAEVSDYLHERGKNKKNNKVIIAVGVIALVVLVAIYVLLNK